MANKQITKEEALFYLEMIDSVYAPSFKPKFGNSKPYYQLLKNRDSKEYKTFILVYHHFRDNLVERDQTILDLYYRIDGHILTLKEIGKVLGISESRVQQLRNRANHLIAKDIREIWLRK